MTGAQLIKRQFEYVEAEIANRSFHEALRSLDGILRDHRRMTVAQTKRWHELNDKALREGSKPRRKKSPNA